MWLMYGGSMKRDLTIALAAGVLAATTIASCGGVSTEDLAAKMESIGYKCTEPGPIKPGGTFRYEKPPPGWIEPGREIDISTCEKRENQFVLVLAGDLPQTATTGGQVLEVYHPGRDWLVGPFTDEASTREAYRALKPLGGESALIK
ncbi:MAG: hypothetical protein ACRDPT_11880 [Streptomycetales bacterium]